MPAILKTVLMECSKLKYVEEIQIIYSFKGYGKYYDTEINENIFPETMQNVKNIIIFALSLDDAKVFRKISQRKFSYDLKVIDFGEMFVELEPWGYLYL